MDAVATEPRELAFAGVVAQAGMVRAQAVSARGLVQGALDRIEALDERLNAFRLTFAERALTEADQAAARARGGDDRPLLGVPIAVKDDQAVGGSALVWGSGARPGAEETLLALSAQIEAARPWAARRPPVS